MAVGVEVSIAMDQTPQVLDAVGRVLRLTSAERRHLYVLAGLNPPAYEVEPGDQQMCDGLRRLIDAWAPYPAHIMDAYYKCVLYNDAASMVLGLRPENRQNCVMDFFLDPIYRSRSEGWEQNAATLVAQFRTACSECPDDEGFRGSSPNSRS